MPDYGSVASRVALVTGAGGFIGGHLVNGLLARGYGAVRAVDIKPLDSWHQVAAAAESRSLDLSRRDPARAACRGVTDVFNLAADMGGIGFIALERARCMLNVLISTHMLQGALDEGVERFFFASSACVYPQRAQRDADVAGLRESDCYPADPEDGYGWEKLFSERMCRHFREDFGLETRVGRFHNIYGPHGAFVGGREKAPAAVCRKVAEAVLGGDPRISIWGDGRQTRSFTYIDDCVEGIWRIMAGDCCVPLNLGSDERVTLEQLVELVEGIAGVRLERTYEIDRPTGVRGRNSDNTLIRRELGWAPSTRLADGMARTYAWVFEQMARRVGGRGGLAEAGGRRG